MLSGLGYLLETRWGRNLFPSSAVAGWIHFLVVDRLIDVRILLLALSQRLLIAPHCAAPIGNSQHVFCFF